MHNTGQSLTEVLRRIRSAEQQYNRIPNSVKLLAVSKKKPVSDIRAAYAAGQCDFAENYVQEAIAKIQQLKDIGIQWHFIGPVQSNKTRVIAENFDWAHSIDREKIARRLNDARPSHLAPLNVCIQLNTSGEESKSGINPSELTTLANICVSLPNIKLRGLMALPAPITDFNIQRASFKLVHQHWIKLRQTYTTLDTLSMGTTNDYIAAIAEGSTMVRIGTAIFGERTTSKG